MKELSFLLKKYQNLGVKEIQTKEIIKKVFQKEFDAEISNKQILISGENLKIKISGPIKSELLMQKKKIEKLINDELENQGHKTKKLSQN